MRSVSLSNLARSCSSIACWQRALHALSYRFAISNDEKFQMKDHEEECVHDSRDGFHGGVDGCVRIKLRQHAGGTPQEDGLCKSDPPQRQARH